MLRSLSSRLSEGSNDDEKGFDAAAAVAQREQAASAVGSPNTCTDPPILTGQALARLSVISFVFTKDWKPCFWVLRKNKLHIYGSETEYKAHAPGTGAKKEVTLTERLQVGDIKYKSYGGEHGGLHHFKIEELIDGKPSVVMKLASKDREELTYLHFMLTTRLKEEIHKRIQYSVKVVGNAGIRQSIIENEVMREHTRKGSR